MILAGNGSEGEEDGDERDGSRFARLEIDGKESRNSRIEFNGIGAIALFALREPSSFVSFPSFRCVDSRLNNRRVVSGSLFISR